MQSLSHKAAAGGEILKANPQELRATRPPMTSASALPAVALALKVPDDLSEVNQWLLWRFETRNGRITKVPYQANGRKADSTDPKAWASFDDCLRAWGRNAQRYAGLGFVFFKADSFAGIDLDDCLDSEGNVKPWACGIIERFGDTYMEVSPSGHGIKIWARGALPANLPGVKVQDGSIEMYDHFRYFALTGHIFRGAPLEIEDHSADLLTLYERLTGGRKGYPLQPLPGGRIPYGQQHHTLVSIVGTLRRRRVCDEAIEACLQAINEHQCEKPGPRENISRMVRSSRTWQTRTA